MTELTNDQITNLLHAASDKDVSRAEQTRCRRSAAIALLRRGYSTEETGRCSGLPLTHIYDLARIHRIKVGRGRSPFVPAPPPAPGAHHSPAQVARTTQRLAILRGERNLKSAAIVRLTAEVFELDQKIEAHNRELA